MKVNNTLRCECGSEDLCLAYRVPVYAYVSDGQVTRVVVTDQGVTGGVARCQTCARFWLIDQIPDMSAWTFATPVPKPPTEKGWEIEVKRTGGEWEPFSTLVLSEEPHSADRLRTGRDGSTVQRAAEDQLVNPVRGHALIHEGAAVEFEPVFLGGSQAPVSLPRRTNKRQGIGYCECGAASGELPSDAARQRWHREHKQEIAKR